MTTYPSDCCWVYLAVIGPPIDVQSYELHVKDVPVLSMSGVLKIH